MLVDQDDTPLFLGAIHRVFAGTSFDDVLLAASSVGLAGDASCRRARPSLPLPLATWS